MMRLKRAFGIVLVIALISVGAAPTANATFEPTTSPVASASVTFVDPSRSTGNVSSSRTLPTMIFYPTNKIGFFKTNPLIVFAHGFSANGPIYAPLLRQIASHGYVVAAPTFPLTHGGTPGGPQLGDYVNQPADVSFVITKLLELNEDKTSPIFHRIVRHEIGVAGHSLGAITALGFSNTCCDDPRVDATVPISGIRLPFPGGTYFTSSPQPLMLVHGDGDSVVPYSGSVTAYDDAPVPKFLVTLLGADHVPFRLGTNPPNAAPASEVVTVNSMVTFFDLYLHNGKRGVKYIEDAADEPGVSTLQETLR